MILRSTDLQVKMVVNTFILSTSHIYHKPTKSKIQPKKFAVSLIYKCKFLLIFILVILALTELTFLTMVD